MISLPIAIHILQLTLGLCLDGATASCTPLPPGCTRALKTCDGGYWGPCECVQGVSCDDSNVCTTDWWNGTSCVHSAVTVQTLCRSATGPCDVAEYCSNGSCPPDAFAPSSQTCRASAGPCDVVEYCTGSSAACPADALRPSSYVCRDAAGPCDEAEYCTGSSASCPGDSLRVSGYVCRASAGVCDVAETCTGNSTGCPADGFAQSWVQCRASAGPCDWAENCTGWSPSCPSDSFRPGGSVCRASAGVCDVAETCTGYSATCPSDGFASSAVQCRASAGPCDSAENCTGSSASCPGDSFLPAGSVCRPSAGVCDVAEQCTGSTPSCPNDVKQPSTYICRPAQGDCDVADTCNGTDSTCPASAGSPPVGKSCSDANACTTADACTSSGTCVGRSLTAAEIDDGNPCTDDSCDPAAGIRHVPAPAGRSCSDGNVCNGAEACNSTGQCLAGSSLPVDDGNPCTTDWCDPIQGVQHSAAVGQACSDGNACTTGDMCTSSATCVGTPLTAAQFDDHNSCTVDSCDPVLGITHVPGPGGLCSDGNACNGIEACNLNGQCVAGTPPLVDDGDPCTEDSCDPMLGVRHHRIVNEVCAPPDVIRITGVTPGLITNAVPLEICYSVTDVTFTVTEGVLDGLPFQGCTFAFMTGEHALTVTASDSEGTSTSIQLAFTIDRESPTLTVEAPAPGAAVGNAISVAVIVSDVYGVAGVDANGVDLVLGGDGRYHGNVPLQAGGSNILVITATDLAGNVAHTTVPVVLDLEAPILAVWSPIDGEVLFLQWSSQDVLLNERYAQLTVTGTVSDTSSVRVTVDGLEASVWESNFAGPPAMDFARTLTLPGGEHLITIVATDEVSNTSTTVRRLRLVVDPEAEPRPDIHWQGTVACAETAGCSSPTTQWCINNSAPAAQVLFTHDAAGHMTAVTNTTSDVQNCGCLGHACESTANGVPTCTAGLCGLLCNPGYVLMGTQCVPLNIPTSTSAMRLYGTLTIDPAVADVYYGWGLFDPNDPYNSRALAGRYVRLLTDAYPFPTVFDVRLNGESHVFFSARNCWWPFSCFPGAETDIITFEPASGSARFPPVHSAEASSTIGTLAATNLPQIEITGMRRGSTANEVALTGTFAPTCDSLRIRLDRFAPTNPWFYYNVWALAESLGIDNSTVIRSADTLSFRTIGQVLDSTPYEVTVSCDALAIPGYYQAHFRGMFGGVLPPPPPLVPSGGNWTLSAPALDIGGPPPIGSTDLTNH